MMGGAGLGISERGQLINHNNVPARTFDLGQNASRN